MSNIILFGGPGSGKGTQGARMAQRHGMAHVSTGEVLRKHIADDTELGRIANSYISKGHLIPDDLMMRVVEHMLDSEPELTDKGVIFDGFPRTLDQARALDDLFKRRGMNIDKVIGLEVPDDVLTERLLKRGAETGRADDNADTIKSRLDVYHNQTAPLRDYYSRDGRYAAIDGAKGIDDIAADIDSALAGPK